MGAILAGGLVLMRARIFVYVALAAVCAAIEWYAYGRTDIVALLTDAASGHPLPLIVQPPLGLVLGLSLVAQFVIIPTAVAQLVPAFRLTLAGALIMILTLAIVSIVTDVGYAFAIIPGIACAVLLSQVLIGVLVRLRQGMSLRETAEAFSEAVRGSYGMTRGHFATTLGVLILSLAILIVPFCFFAFWVIVLGGDVPWSLVATTPALFLLFVYLECSRYTLVVRWYRRLARNDAPGAGTVSFERASL
jgi:hypothetical protein